MDEIDKFVAYLIAEECEGCTLCEPRLEGSFVKGVENVACVSEGRIKKLLELAEEFKKARENNGERTSN